MYACARHGESGSSAAHGRAEGHGASVGARRKRRTCARGRRDVWRAPRAGWSARRLAGRAACSRLGPSPRRRRPGHAWCRARASHTHHTGGRAPAPAEGNVPNARARTAPPRGRACPVFRQTPQAPCGGAYLGLYLSAPRAERERGHAARRAHSEARSAHVAPPRPASPSLTRPLRATSDASPSLPCPQTDPPEQRV